MYGRHETTQTARQCSNNAATTDQTMLSNYTSMLTDAANINYGSILTYKSVSLSVMAPPLCHLPLHTHQTRKSLCFEGSNYISEKWEATSNFQVGRWV